MKIYGNTLDYAGGSKNSRKELVCLPQVMNATSTRCYGFTVHSQASAVEGNPLMILSPDFMADR